MNRMVLFVRLILIFSLFGLVSCQPVTPEAAPEARELTVLTGAGQDTVSVNAFFPESIRVRVGDTVTWKINSDEPHTATFLSGEPAPQDPIPIPDRGPGEMMLNPLIAFPSRAPDAPVESYSGTGYLNSGMLSVGKVVPPLEEFSVTFEAPGVYQYNCLLHPAMVGEVVVEAANTADLASQDEIDAQVQPEIEALIAEADMIRAGATNSEMIRSEPGPNDSTFWHIPAGVTGSDPRLEIYDFFPKNATIQAGDTVIWTSTFFHHVAFHPGEPVPEFVLPEPQDAGPPILVVNPKVLAPIKPSGEFDGTAYFSSGLIGAGPVPGGTTFAMTFTEPGTYNYVCAVHRPLGMEGTITVVAE